MHRGIPEHGPWWRLGRDLLFLTVGAGIFSALYILLSLAVHGTVNW